MKFLYYGHTRLCRGKEGIEKNDKERKQRQVLFSFPPLLQKPTPQIFHLFTYIFSTTILIPLEGRQGGKNLIYTCGFGLSCNLSRFGERNFKYICFQATEKEKGTAEERVKKKKIRVSHNGKRLRIEFILFQFLLNHS